MWSSCEDCNLMYWPMWVDRNGKTNCRWCCTAFKSDFRAITHPRRCNRAPRRGLERDNFCQCTQKKAVAEMFKRMDRQEKVGKSFLELQPMPKTWKEPEQEEFWD